MHSRKPVGLHWTQGYELEEGLLED